MKCVSKFKVKSYAIRCLYLMPFVFFFSIKYELWPGNQKKKKNHITQREQNQYLTRIKIKISTFNVYFPRYNNNNNKYIRKGRMYTIRGFD